MTRRVSTLLIGVLLLVAAACAAVALNVLLLGRASASNDPVGRLTPRTHLPAAPTWTVRPRRGEVENEGADD
ncbi:MAG: hypothetical protein ACYDCH_13800 [Gaiellaceae bacterium]